MTVPAASELDQPVRLPHALSAAAVARQVGSDPARGLSEEEAQHRLARLGPNALERPPRPPYVTIALRQFADPLVALLLAAAAVSALIGEAVEAVAIGVIVFLNAALGFAQELGAERAILALRETVQRRASVIRDGRERELAVADLVPGDLVVLREGERIPADGRVVRAEGLVGRRVRPHRRVRPGGQVHRRGARRSCARRALFGRASAGRP